MCRFLPLIFFPASKPGGSEPPIFRAPDALAVDDGRSRAGVASRLLAAGDIGRVVQLVQRAVMLPALEVAVDRAARRPFLRDRGPLAARTQYINQPADHLAHVHRALVAAVLGSRDQARA